MDPTKGGGEDDPLMNNPLCMEEDSPWQKYHESQELISEIDKDLGRLYPTGCDDFFEDAKVKTLLQSVLFMWSLVHPDTSYRQGMHELLAPIIWLAVNEVPPAEGDDETSRTLRTLMDHESIEADAYWMFTHLMVQMEPFFEVPAPRLSLYLLFYYSPRDSL